MFHAEAFLRRFSYALLGLRAFPGDVKILRRYSYARTHMQALASERKKGGRPPNPDGTSLSKTMNFRVLPDLYERIAQAAGSNGRSISEEVAIRLARSFNADEIEARRFGDKEVAYLANLFAACVNVIQAKTGRKVWDDPETCVAVKSAIDGVLDASSDIMKDVSSVAEMQRRFDRDVMQRTWQQLVEMAENASAEPKLSLAEIMGR